MARSGSRKTTRRAVSPVSEVPPGLKLFRPISWLDRTCAGRYVSHLLRELGRLGLELEDIERREKPPHVQTVLSDLIDWLDEHPGPSFANLVNWQAFDLDVMSSRLEEDHSAKPRIEISARLTRMNNLSVCWYPGGWRHSLFICDSTAHSSINLIPRRKWSEPPDFRWFIVGEKPTSDARPTNELMYLRGVGGLDPDPRTRYGPSARYNHDVVDSILICAVRSAYEALIEQCRLIFEVEALETFEFEVRNEADTAGCGSRPPPVHRVVSWSLENATELRLRREREAAREAERRERIELDSVPARFGFTLEKLTDVLMRAAQRKSTQSAPPSDEVVNRSAAKALRRAGFKVDAGDVRRLRRLMERLRPELLPKDLRPEPTPTPPALSNVLRFPRERT